MHEKNPYSYPIHTHFTHEFCQNIDCQIAKMPPFSAKDFAGLPGLPDLVCRLLRANISSWSPPGSLGGKVSHVFPGEHGPPKIITWLWVNTY